MTRWWFAAMLALVSLAAAQNPPATLPAAAPGPSPKAKLMLEADYDYFSDDGTGGQGVLARIYDDGTVEYRDHHWKEARTGHVDAGAIAQLGAILNHPATRSLKKDYEAFDQWGFTAMTYKIRFFSGTVERQVTATNVLPIRKGHRDEYPTALLRLVCAVDDIRHAAEPHPYDSGRGDCNEFPQIAKPNLQPPKQ